MDMNSPSFEATLLSQSGLLPDLDLIKEPLLDLVAEHGQHCLSFEQLTPEFYLIECRKLQVLLALSDETLPTEAFMSAAHDPGPDGQTSTPAMLEHLTQMRSSVTVMVLPSAKSERYVTAQLEDAMRSLCWALLDHLFAHHPTDLVFWADTETLYSGAGFDAACREARARAQAQAASSAPPTAPLAAALPLPDVSALSSEALAWAEQSPPAPQSAGSALGSSLSRVAALAANKSRALTERAQMMSFF